LVLVSGGIRQDDGGNQVAYDASYLFQWLDRFGWTIPIEDQQLDTVRRFAQRGAVTYLAEFDAMHDPASPSGAFEEQLRRTYAVLGQCDDTLVAFDLQSTLPLAEAVRTGSQRLR
jgi:hypothetical protein